jgi:hypothetical protein
MLRIKLWNPGNPWLRSQWFRTSCGTNSYGVAGFSSNSDAVRGSGLNGVLIFGAAGLIVYFLAFRTTDRAGQNPPIRSLAVLPI